MELNIRLLEVENMTIAFIGIQIEAKWFLNSRAILYVLFLDCAYNSIDIVLQVFPITRN